MNKQIFKYVVMMALAAVLCGGVWSHATSSSRVLGQPLSQSAGQKAFIDIKADITTPVYIGDSSVVTFVGNFAAQHNGAVITCDSAVRYSENRFEFFGNVLINQRETYAYGERADYNGNINVARLYSDLVKVVDGEATLYTYEFEFNTLTEIGKFDGGGILTNGENRVEARRGYYNTKTKELSGSGEVEMHNDEYDMRTDSIIYNLESELAQYFTNTNIWNKAGDYLSCDRGYYTPTPDTLYNVTLNGYVLTTDQEVWGDTINYYRALQHIITKHDIQIDDTPHKVLAFGNYGEYWQTPGNAILTRNPVVVSYDTEQGDSLFIKADTLWLETINRFPDEEKPVPTVDSASMMTPQAIGEVAPLSDTLVGARQEHPNMQAREEAFERAGEQDPERRDPVREQERDSSMTAQSSEDQLAAMQQMAAGAAEAAQGESDSLAQDSTMLDSITPQDTLSPKELAKMIERERKDSIKAVKDSIRNAKLDEIAAKRKEQRIAIYKASLEQEERRLNRLRLRTESRLKAKQQRAEKRGKSFEVDSTELLAIDSLLAANQYSSDSLAQDTMAVVSDSTAMADSLAADSTEVEILDSIYRITKGYRNVKIFRSDMQAVCDSLVSNSSDSTTHLYIRPALWSGESQITSDAVDVYSKNQQLTKAVFTGAPMMISRIDTAFYNQVAGKTITARFANNEIYRNDVDGNVQTIYFTQDDVTGDVTDMAFVESGSATFYIEDRNVVAISYRTDVTAPVYPLGMVPEDLSMKLNNFEWRGAERPVRDSIFDRTIRPSKRELVNHIMRPQFPIAKRIDSHKKRLVEHQKWSDRVDVLSPEVVQWMRSISYE